MSSEGQGLAFRLEPSSNQRTIQENSLDGKLIRFIDMKSIDIEAMPVDDSIYVITLDNIQANGENFKFTLVTIEEKLTLESNYDTIAAINWLKTLQKMVEFIQIPLPASKVIVGGMNHHNNSVIDTSILNHSSKKLSKEFTVNSTVIYSISSDIVYLQQYILSTYSIRYSILNELLTKISVIFKLLIDIKYNRETILYFGERLEEIIRCLGHSENGLLLLADTTHIRIMTSALLKFHQKLNEIYTYFYPLSQQGWLLHSLNSNTVMKVKLSNYDNDIVSIFQLCYKSIMSKVVLVSNR